MEIPAEMDWQALLHIAQRQGTAPLVCDVLLQLPENVRPPKSLQAQMKMLSAQSMMLQEQQRVVLRRAITALQAGGITPVLLKGLCLAQNYPKPWLRTCGDVDIYVGKDAYHKGAALLREAFPEAALFEEEKDYYKHYNLTLDTTAIEMHRVSAIFTHPKDAGLYDVLERDGLQQHIVPFANDEGAWNEPEPKFNILFCFIHSWDHFVTESANVRQLCDLALLIKKYNHHDNHRELADYLYANLKALHMLQAWQLYAYILVNYIGLSKSQCPLYTDSCAKRAERVLRHIMDGRQITTDKKEIAPSNIIFRKLYTLRERLKSACVMAYYDPHFARHMVATTFAQSYHRFKIGENTRKWE